MMRLLSNARGVGLVQALILAIVLAGLGLVVAQMGQRLSLASKQVNLKNQASLSAEVILNMIKTEDFVSQNFSASSTKTILDCLIASSGVCPDQMANPDVTTLLTTAPQLRRLMIQKVGGATIYDGTVVTQGLTKDGVVCNGFPSAACPFHYDLYWGLACNPSDLACDNPIMVLADLKLDNKTYNNTVNSDRFKVRTKITTNLDLLKSACKSLLGATPNGSFDLTTKLCRCNDGGIISFGCKTIKQNTGCVDGKVVTFDAGTNTLVCP
jgi:hypothetical protein